MKISKKIVAGMAFLGSVITVTACGPTSSPSITPTEDPTSTPTIEPEYTDNYYSNVIIPFNNELKIGQKLQIHQLLKAMMVTFIFL